MPVIPELSRLRQEDHKFEASLGCIVRLSQISKQTNKETQSVSFSLNCQTQALLCMVIQNPKFFLLCCSAISWHTHSPGPYGWAIWGYQLEGKGEESKVEA
jgi:hypothetical protein